jgi:hypothetical protein
MFDSGADLLLLRRPTPVSTMPQFLQMGREHLDRRSRCELDNYERMTSLYRETGFTVQTVSRLREPEKRRNNNHIFEVQ